MNQQVGRYRIVSKLGKGAMGVVYLAEDPVLNRKVAIKTVELSADDRRDSNFLRERLVRDGRAAAGLSHPNIVSVYDVLEEGDFGYLVMEYIAGQSLAQYLARTPRPDSQFVVRVLRDMASALDYTHARGIIHRDIKPANVMLDSATGGVKIMDFGIARIAETRTMTPTGMVMGTLEYMSPEQIKGEPIDGRTDQFALAAVAYEMLTGTTLFGEQTFATLAYKIVNEMPPPLRMHAPSLPPGVEEVVARGLRKSPAERFESCGAFVSALDRAFAGEVPAAARQTQEMLIPGGVVPVPPPPATAQPFPTPPTPPFTTGPMPVAPLPHVPVKPNRGLSIAIGLTAAVLIGAGLFYFWKKPVSQTTEPVAAVADNPAKASGGALPAPAAITPAPPFTAPKAPAPPPLKQVRPAQTQPAAAEIPKPPQDASAEPPNEAPDSFPSEPEPAGEAKVPLKARNEFRVGQEMVKANLYPAAIKSFSKAIEAKPDFMRAHFQRGLAYLHINEPGNALADFQEILNKLPRDGNAIAQRGVCHARLGDEEAAFADFNHALEIRPNNSAALNGRGLIYLHRNQPQKAIADFNAAILTAPKFAYAYANRARAQEKIGNHPAAEADMAKARALGLPDK